MLKMKNYEELSENSYRLTVCYGYDGKGKQIRKRKTLNYSKATLTDNQKEKEVQANYYAFKREVENGIYLDKGNITFEEFTLKYLEEYAEMKLADKTVDRYKSLLFRINKALGSLKLFKIEPLHIIKFMNNLAEDGIRADHTYILKDEYIPYIKENKKKLYEVVNERTVANILKGKATNGRAVHKIADVTKINISALFNISNAKERLSQQTLLHHYKLLNSILNKAVKWGFILHNPVNGANDYCPRVEQKEKEFLNEVEIVKMLELIESEPLKYQVAVYIAVLGGFRIGEVIALKWTDIDFDTNYLSITKSVQYISGKGSTQKAPKNNSSIRTVKLPDKAMLKLRELQKEQTVERQELGSQWIDNDNLFTQWNGERIFYSTISQWFAKWISTTKLPNITFHGLRHSHASLLIAQGKDIASVSKRLGHSRISTTLDVYTHVDSTKDEEIANTLDSMFI